MYSIEICTSIQESNIFYIYYKYMNIYSKWDKQRSSISCWGQALLPESLQKNFWFIVLLEIEYFLLYRCHFFLNAFGV